MNTGLIAAALRALADAIETPATGRPGEAPPPATATPDKVAKPRGRPVKGESIPTPAAAAASPAQVPAPAPLRASTATLNGAALPAGIPAAAATANLTHAALGPVFLAAAREHGRIFVVKCMKKYGVEAFDKVPVAKLPEFKLMLEAGPQPETESSVDVADLMA